MIETRWRESVAGVPSLARSALAVRAALVAGGRCYGDIELLRLHALVRRNDYIVASNGPRGRCGGGSRVEVRPGANSGLSGRKHPGGIDRYVLRRRRQGDPSIVKA